MTRATVSLIFVFARTGLASGLCSGFSVLLPPLAVLLPGAIFGVAISQSIDGSIESLRRDSKVSLVGCSTVAYIAAIVAALLSMRLTGFDNGLLSTAIAGAIAGGVGALLVALSIYVEVSRLHSRRMVLFVTLSGAVLGALVLLIGVYISDHTRFGHPFDDLVVYPLWQAGVAAAIPVFRRGRALAAR